MRADSVRTILVNTEQPYLWSALRSKLSEQLVRVRWAPPADLAAIWNSCRPWPWVVIGAGDKEARDLGRLLAGLPIPLYWLGAAPGGLAPTRLYVSWEQLADDLRQTLVLDLDGLRLAPRRGIRLPTGSCVVNVPELEGLMGAFPSSLRSFARLRRARRAIERHQLSCRLEATQQWVTLGGSQV